MRFMYIFKIFLISITLSVLFLAGCGTNNNHLAEKPSTDWNAHFVIWNEHMYVIKTREKDKELVSEVEEQIGTIAYYSDIEGKMYTSNFSNVFEEGTKLYKIKAVDTAEAIAVESDDGTYIKAIKQE